MLKTYSLFITICYSTALTIVCLINLSGLSVVGFSNGDKLFHSLAYFILTFLWYGAFFHKFKLNKTKALIYAVLISIIFGIIIEVLQGILTATRDSDIQDVFANTLGAVVASLIIGIKNKYVLK